MLNKKRYNQEYFGKISSLKNWKLDGKNMAKVIFDIFKPKSVIDFGCGTARIIENMHSNFKCEVQGVEGSLREASPYISEKVKRFIKQADVTEDIKPDKKYDLVICTEVAEHIFPEGSIHLINNLCSHGDTIVFAAAPPGQTSPSHINLHPIEWWQKLFFVHGFQIDRELTLKYKQKLKEKNVKQIYINNGTVFRKMKNNFGVIIRSVGERTEKLCLDAIRLYAEPLIIKNIHPHTKANLVMYENMLKNPKDWWLSVDADVVLKKDWIDEMDKLIEGCDDILGSIPKEYEFILNKIHNRGCRTYNGKFIQNCYDNMNKVIQQATDNLFPEDWARKQIQEQFNVLKVKPKIKIGFHGCEQYYIHIYNAYVRYAIRTRGAKDEAALIKNFRNPIQPNHQDRKVAIKGWNDGWSNPKLVKTKDFTTYIKLDIPEKEPLDMTLEEFYEKYGKFLK